MIVIADTSPINYLVVIGEIDILPKLFVEVIIPQAVFDELNHEQAPTIVRDFINRKFSWLKIRKTEKSAESGLEKLGRGERQAIILAEKLKPDFLIIDERAGYTEAIKRNLPVVGTLFILELAAENNLLDLSEAIGSLKQTSFRVSPKILQEILERNL